MAGAGWALLPSYTVKEELRLKLQMEMDIRIFGSSQYGIWWLRNQSYLKDHVEKLTEWLQKKEL